MKTQLPLLTLIAFSVPTLATVVDDFEDGDYTSNPTWTLEIDQGAHQFVADPIRPNNTAYQVHGTGGGNRSIYTHVGDGMAWEQSFEISFDFLATDWGFHPQWNLSTANIDYEIGFGFWLDPSWDTIRLYPSEYQTRLMDQAIEIEPSAFSLDTWYRMHTVRESSTGVFSTEIRRLDNGALLAGLTFLPSADYSQLSSMDKLWLGAEEVQWQLFDNVSLVPEPSKALLVSSHDNDAVLRYDGDTGVFLGAFVSAGAGGLNGPTGLIIGPDGSLYVSSVNSDSVLRYDGQTGTFISAFVDTGLGGLDEPQGLAFGPDGNLYVSSFATDSVLSFDGETGEFIDAFVQSGSGGLDDPVGLIIGPDANLYVVSNLSSSILRYDGRTGAFMDVFASDGLTSPWGAVFGPDGNLYISLVVPDNVVRIDGQTGALIDIFVPHQSGGINIPQGLVFSSDEDLFVSSNFNASIVQFNGLTGSFVEDFVPTGNGGLVRPTFLIFDNDWDMDSVANDVDNCRFIQNPIQTDDDSDGFGNPCDRCPGFDDHQDSNSNGVPDGCDLDCNSNSVPDDLDLAAATSADCNANNIPDECESPEAFVASRGTGEIFTFNQFNGEFLGVFADVATLGVSDPGGISLSLIGNLFVASNDGSLVLELDRMSGELVRTFGTGGELDRPRGVAFTASGSVLIASRDTHQIEEFDMASGNHLGVFASGGGLEGPFGLAMGPNGNLFVASANTDQILEYDGADGSFIGVFADQGLDSPFGISFGPDGNLFVASWSADQIVEFAGPTSESPGVLLDSFGPACGLSQPTWLAFRDDGRILASNSAESHVMLFGPDGTCFDGQFLGGNDLDLPRGVAVYPSPAVKGDHDQDCLVTLADYSQFEICSAIGGPDTPVVFQDCDAVFDFDYDKDIDLQDFAVFATNVDLQQQRP